MALGITPQVVLAQGVIYLSNLNIFGNGFSVGGGSQSFQTGVASDGYILNWITLSMGEYLPNASNFNISLYSDDIGQAGVLIGALSGDTDPETAGQYVYTASDILLDSLTTYWIVATCDSSSPNIISPPDGYTWQMANSLDYASANGWNIDNSGNSSLIGNGLLQFAVNATPVPEPNISGLFIFGGLLFSFCRSRFTPTQSSPAACWRCRGRSGSRLSSAGTEMVWPLARRGNDLASRTS